MAKTQLKNLRDSQHDVNQEHELMLQKQQDALRRMEIAEKRAHQADDTISQLRIQMNCAEKLKEESQVRFSFVSLFYKVFPDY